MLNDGLLPTEPDAPDDNFFFRSATGRLRSILATRSISSRSTPIPGIPDRADRRFTSSMSPMAWLPNSIPPKRSVDPQTVGWKLAADVDTRTKYGDVGGQYGVSIGDTKGSIGHAQYLLFDISSTDKGGFQSQTFFSEITVIDKNELLQDAAANPARVDPNAPYQIIINIDEVPEMKAWADQLRPICEKWYPILVKTLPSPGYTAPRRFTITFRKDKPGVADTSGRHVNCAASWFKQHPDDFGAVVHEMVHVVQQYNWGNCPSWLTEGIADYYRWFVYEPPSARPHPNPDRAKYTDGYRVTAAFLDFIVRKYDKDFVVKMNVELRKGRYKPELWNNYCGKSLDDLWAEYVATLRQQ